MPADYMCKAFVIQNWRNIHIADIPKLVNIALAIGLKRRYSHGMVTMDL
jgi:hypothetical protein